MSDLSLDLFLACLLAYKKTLVLSAQLLFSSSGADTKNGPTSVEPLLRLSSGQSSTTTMRLVTPVYGWSVLPRLSRRRASSAARECSLYRPAAWLCKSCVGAFGCRCRCRCLGGAEGTRTPDLRRAKAALSQLSYGPAPQLRVSTGWASLESNQGPQSYQDCALAD